MPSTVNRPPIESDVNSFVWRQWFADLSFVLTPLGFQIPQLTTTQRDAIVSPQAGLLIYNTTTNKLNVFTTAWEQVTSV